MEVQIPLKTLLAALSKVELSDADESFVVHRIASLSAASPNDMAVIIDRGDASVFDPVSVQAITQSKAGVFLAQAPVVAGKKYVLVDDVLTALDQLAALINRHHDQQAAASQTSGSTVHPTAVVGIGTVIGAGSTVGAQVFIGNHCVIGRNVLLYPGVKIMDGCNVGDNTIIHAGVVIGSDGFGYQVTKTGLRKIPQIGIVRIGAHVEIGANCTIDRAAFDETVIGDGVKMDNSIHIAHNVIIGPATAILAQTGIAGSARIGMGCQIGGQVAIKDHATIGNGVKIVSKSAVMNDLRDGEVVCGIPAIPFSQWKRLTVLIQRLPDAFKTMQEMRGAKRGVSWWWRLFGG